MIILPSGKLTFSLEGYWPGEKFCHKWTDKVDLPLEERLVEITKGFILTIKHTRNKRLESEESDRLYAIEQELKMERARLLKIENKRR